MFPLPWNKAYRKKDGSLTTIDDVIQNGGGGGNELPDYDSSDAGKVLSVDNSGELEWSEGGGSYTLPTASSSTKGGIKVGDAFKMVGEYLQPYDYFAPAYTPAYEDIGRPVFKPSTTSGKYKTAMTKKPINYEPQSELQPTFNPGDYDISDVYLPALSDNFEYYNSVNSQLISDLSLVTLHDGVSAVTSIELESAITNYSALIIQGCYISNGDPSSYDTSLIYVNPAINTPYWFGMKDRNNSYGGTITFSDGTHGTLTGSARTFKVYGVPASNRSRSKKK